MQLGQILTRSRVKLLSSFAKFFRNNGKSCYGVSTFTLNLLFLVLYILKHLLIFLYKLKISHFNWPAAVEACFPLATLAQSQNKKTSVKREKRDPKGKKIKNFVFLVLWLRLCQKSSSVKRQNVSAIVTATYEPPWLRRLCSSVKVLPPAVALVPTSLVWSTLNNNQC